MEVDRTQLYNDIIIRYQTEQLNYLLELQLVVRKIKTIFDNPKSGINADTVDVIFGNITDIVTVELAQKDDIEEALLISHSHTVISIGTVFKHNAKEEVFDVYVYYANNYPWCLNELDRLHQHKDILKYTFADCVKLGFTDDTITNLLDVLLFKPVQHVTNVFGTIRELVLCLENMRLTETMTSCCNVELELLKDALTLFEDAEISIQNVLDGYEYKYYTLNLVPRAHHLNNLNQPHLLFSGYVYKIVDKKTECKLLQISEEALTINSLDGEHKERILFSKRHPISHVIGVKDYHNDLNQFSITLQDNVLQFLSNSVEYKDTIVITLTVLLSRRVFIMEPNIPTKPVYKPVHKTDYTVMLSDTLDNLVDKLLYTESSTYPQHFLTIYKLFTSSRELLNILQLKFTKHKEKKEKCRVLCVMRSWLILNNMDFTTDGLLSSTFNIFLDSCKQYGWAVKWVRLLQKLLVEQVTVEQYQFVWYLTQDARKYSLLALHPVELAQHITIIEHGYFRQLQLYHTLGAESFHEFQEMYLFWMRRSIVETGNFEERVATLRCVLEVLKTLFELQNYSGMFVVYNVLQSAEVSRLKYSLQPLLDQYTHLLQEIEDMTKNDFEGYWEMLKTKQPPIIPILGLYRTHTQAPVTGEDGMIQFEQCTKLYDTVLQLNRMQRVRYKLGTETSIKRFLLNLRPYERKTRKEFLSDLYEKSLLIEPCFGPAAYHPRSTEFDLSRNPAQFFSWKSTSETTMKPLAIVQPEPHNKGPQIRTLLKSKSFYSKQSAPPLPPRVTDINKSNCLSRSRSFETTTRPLVTPPYSVEYRGADVLFSSNFNIMSPPVRRVKASKIPRPRLDLSPPALPRKTRRPERMRRAEYSLGDSYDCISNIRTPPPIPCRDAPPLPPRAKYRDI